MWRVLILAIVCAGVLASASASGRRPRITILRFVDQTRVARFRTGRVVPRTLVTYLRYPTSGRPPYPVVVFGHGFAVTPGLYAPLLNAWARAGFLVAAPLFPVERANAPGGPDEADLVNQPRDISFVISRLLGASRNPHSRLHRMIDPHRIAVAGQSDGGETAFAVAYERSYFDPRIAACIVLSGAQLPGEPVQLRSHHPPLLAVQGTADTINAPSLTDQLYKEVTRPKFMLVLVGAGHISPYSTNPTELAVVKRVTIAFLNVYLRDRPLHGLSAAARAPGIARFAADS